MAENVLHVENMTMQFGGVVAVNNLSLDVNRGEIVALWTKWCRKKYHNKNVNRNLDAK